MSDFSAKSPETKAAAPKGNSRRRSAQVLRRITVTAIFAAFAIVLKAFTNLALNIPGLGIKVGVSGIFTFFPAILCGPIYGGIASGLSDLLGYLIAPDGAYIPWLTLTAFCGGVIKGLVWMLLTKKGAANVRWFLLAIFVLVGSFGAAFNISLARDGLMTGMLAKQDTLPLRGEVNRMEEAGELSALSRFAVGLAQYNKDSFTVAAVNGIDGDTVVLPSTATLLGVKGNVTKTAKNLLGDFKGRVVIPANYSTIGDNLASDPSAVTIVSTVGETESAVQKYAKKNGYAFEEISADELERVSLTIDAESMSDGVFRLTNSDTYRKYLAQYVNLAVFGCELAGIVGVLFIGIMLLLGRLRGETGANTANFLRIATAATSAGLIVTTINTFILRVVMPSWNGRAILVLLVPRVAEEIVVCLVQAYIISLLWGIIARGKVRRFIDKL